MATQTRWPTSDGDTVGTWTYSTGTSGWPLVNKEAARDDTKYIISPTTSNCRFGFGFSAFTIPTGSTVASLAITTRGRDVTTGTNRINGCIKIGSTWYNNTTANDPSTSFTSYTSTWTANPATGQPWTAAEVNAIQQFGVIHSDASPALRDSEVFAVVTYTEPASGGTLTFGYTSIGANEGGALDDYGVVQKVNIGQLVTTSRIKAYCRADGQIKPVIYAADGSEGLPGTILAVGAPVNVIGTTPAWYDCPISADLPPGTYWEGYVGSGGVHPFYDTGISGQQETDIWGTNLYTSPMSNPSNSGSGGAGIAASVYLEASAPSSSAFIPIIFMY